MNRVQNNYSLSDHAEHALQVREIEQELARAEKGQPVDIAKTADKLHRLSSTLNQAAGTKMTADVQKAYLAQRQAVQGLTERAKALSPKNTFNMPSWVKPVAYGALAVIGVAAVAFSAQKFLSSPVIPTTGSAAGGTGSGGPSNPLDAGSDGTPDPVNPTESLVEKELAKYKDALAPHCGKSLYPSETDRLYDRFVSVLRPASIPGLSPEENAEFQVAARDLERDCGQQTMSPRMRNFLASFGRQSNEVHTFDPLVKKYQKGTDIDDAVYSKMIDASKRHNPFFHHTIVLGAGDVYDAFVKGNPKMIASELGLCAAGGFTGAKIGKVIGSVCGPVMSALGTVLGGVIGCPVAVLSGTAGYNQIPEGTYESFGNSTGNAFQGIRDFDYIGTGSNIASEAKTFASNKIVQPIAALSPQGTKEDAAVGAAAGFISGALASTLEAKLVTLRTVSAKTNKGAQLLAPRRAVNVVVTKIAKGSYQATYEISKFAMGVTPSKLKFLAITTLATVSGVALVWGVLPAAGVVGLGGAAVASFKDLFSGASQPKKK